jgi:hypothetical protein
VRRGSFAARPPRRGPATTRQTKLNLFPHQALVGIPDALYRMDDGSVAVVDWKDSSAIATNANAMMCAPFDRLPRCALARHALQVSVYGRLLERFHSESVSALFVHNVRSGHTYDLPYLRIEADFLIDAAIACVKRRTEAALEAFEKARALRGQPDAAAAIRRQLCAEDGHTPTTQTAAAAAAARQELDKREVQMVSSTCLLIAAKFNDRMLPPLSELEKVHHHKVLSSEFASLELRILEVLEWKVHVLLPHAFSASLVALCGADLPPDVEFFL